MDLYTPRKALSDFVKDNAKYLTQLDSFFLPLGYLIESHYYILWF